MSRYIYADAVINAKWNAVITLWKGLNILCRYRQVFLRTRTMVNCEELNRLDAPISRIYSLEWNSTCFGQFLSPSSIVLHFTHSNGIHHTVLQIAGSGWNCSSILILLARSQQTCMTYTIVVCIVKISWWWTAELSEICRISFQNKFEKLVHLVGSVIRIYYDARSHEHQSEELIGTTACLIL
jgi:hypothetical protein